VRAGMVERRRFYPRWERRSSCNFVFVGFLLVGFVRATWLRLRKISKPALRGPFPTRGPKAEGFRDSAARVCDRGWMAARVTSWELLLLFPVCSSTRRRVPQAKFAGISHAYGRLVILNGPDSEPGSAHVDIHHGDADTGDRTDGSFLHSPRGTGAPRGSGGCDCILHLRRSEFRHHNQR